MSTSESGEMPMWKTVLLIGVSIGGLTVVLSFYPSFSLLALTFGIVLTLISLVSAVVIGEDRKTLKGIFYANSWLLLFLGLAIRAWGELLSGILIPSIVLLGLYLLAWLIPARKSSLSERLYLSQVAPKSKAGRITLALLLAVAPSAAGITGLVGYFGVQYLSDNATALIIGIMATFVSLSGGQAIAHQLYRNRSDNDARSKVLR